MIRGIVMERKGKSAIIMTADGRFLKVPATACGEACVGEEIAFEAPDVRRRFTRRAVLRASVVAAVATAACLALAFVWYGLRVAPEPAIAAYVTLDINPSVEMAVDADETVLQLYGLNEDGRRLVEGVAYKGKRVADLAAELIDRAERMGFVSPEAEPEIVVATVPVRTVSNEIKDEKDATAAVSELQDRVAEDVAATVKKKLEETRRPTATIIVRSVPEEVREEALKVGMSAGKYAIYLEAAAKQPENEALTPETFKRRSISELAAQAGGLDRLIDVDRKPTADEWKSILDNVNKKQKIQKNYDDDKKSGRGAGPNEYRGSSPSPDSSGGTGNPGGDSAGIVRRPSPSVRPGSVQFGDADDRDASDRFSPRRPSASDQSGSDRKGDRQRNDKRGSGRGDPQMSAPSGQNVVMPGFSAKTPVPGRDKEEKEREDEKDEKPGDGKSRRPSPTDRSDRDERG